MATAAKSISPDGFYVAAAGNIAQTVQFFQPDEDRRLLREPPPLRAARPSAGPAELLPITDHPRPPGPARAGPGVSCCVRPEDLTPARKAATAAGLSSSRQSW